MIIVYKTNYLYNQQFVVVAIDIPFVCDEKVSQMDILAIRSYI